MCSSMFLLPSYSIFLREIIQHMTKVGTLDHYGSFPLALDNHIQLSVSITQVF